MQEITEKCCLKVNREGKIENPKTHLGYFVSTTQEILYVYM